MYKMRNRIWYRKVLRQLRHTFDGSKKSTPQNKNNGKEINSRKPSDSSEEYYKNKKDYNN